MERKGKIALAMFFATSDFLDDAAVFVAMQYIIVGAKCSLRCTIRLSKAEKLIEKL